VDIAALYSFVVEDGKLDVEVSEITDGGRLGVNEISNEMALGLMMVWRELKARGGPELSPPEVDSSLGEGRTRWWFVGEVAARKQRTESPDHDVRLSLAD